jgi:hypothetical protein
VHISSVVGETVSVREALSEGLQLVVRDHDDVDLQLQLRAR